MSSSAMPNLDAKMQSIIQAGAWREGQWPAMPQVSTSSRCPGKDDEFNLTLSGEQC